MTSISRIALLAAVMSAPGAVAFAQDHPAFLPTRDVAVTYQLSNGQQGAQTTHLYYSAAGKQLRIDTPGNAGYVVMDQGSGQRTMVMNDRRQYVSVPLEPGAAEGFVLNSSMTYTRKGPDSVAGVPCTDWTVSSPAADGTACVTEDGVLLSGTGHSRNGGGDTSLVATSVQYGPQPGSLFLPPAGFAKIDPSQMQGPPPGAGGQ